MLRYFLFMLAVSIMFSCKKESETLVFIGSFTENKSAAGLKTYTLDQNTGELELRYQVADLINPSFLKLSPDGRFLYVISESRLATAGYVSSYRISRDSLEFINRVTTGGRNPVHIDVSPDGEHLSVSNYTDASLAFYSINQNGRISDEYQFFAFQDSSIIAGRQDEAHIHSSNFSRDGRYLYAHDLGGDKIRAFEIKDSMILREDLNVQIAPGSGPRHFTFDREGKYGYLMNELGGRIDVFSYSSENGELSLVDSFMTYEDSLEIHRSADIHVTTNNQFLLCTNRGPAENTVVVYGRNPDGGLKLLDRKDSGGSFPRNFAISPKDDFVIVGNKESGNVVVFPFNKNVGSLGPQRIKMKFPLVSSIQILEIN